MIKELEMVKIPQMGLRGTNAVMKSDEGSGQGLASMFDLLEDMGIDREYYSFGLAPEQKQHLASGRKREYPLSNHTVKLTLEGKTVA